MCSSVKQRYSKRLRKMVPVMMVLLKMMVVNADA